MDVYLFFVCLLRKTVGTHDRDKTESLSGDKTESLKTKREPENDGSDEVLCGKKARLEASEELK